MDYSYRDTKHFVAPLEKLSDVKRLLKMEALEVDSIRVPPPRKKTDKEFPWPGWTPMHIACWRGNVPIIELLIDHGADVNLFNEHQQVAISSTHTPPLLFLMKHIYPTNI